MHVAKLIFFISALCLALAGCKEFKSLNDAVDKSSCASNPNASTYNAIGAGTLSSPFVICHPAQFASIGQTPAAWDSHYQLAADLDMTAYDGSSAPLTLSPIGSFDYVTPAKDAFTGRFNGNGHTITNVVMTNTADSSVALFGATEDAEIYDLRITAADITGEQYVGVLVGSNKNTPITNVEVSGTITSTGLRAGGLIAMNEAVGASKDSSIVSAISNVDISGNDSVGGLIGAILTSDSGTANVTNSSSTGNITQSTPGNSIGGFVGYILSTTASTVFITNCHSTGNVTLPASGSFSGGFVGTWGAQDTNTNVGISRSSTTGTHTIPGTFFVPGRVGGFIGLANCQDGATCAISRSRFTGSLTVPAGTDPTYGAGGFIGVVNVTGTGSTATIANSFVNSNVILQGTSSDHIGVLFADVSIATGNTFTVSNTYASGSITGTGLGTSIGAVFGSSSGAVEPIFSSVYYNSTLQAIATGTGTATGYAGQTTAQLRAETTYSGWNFNTIWQIVEGVSYPTLK